jgi:hypothetical protein
MRVAMVPTALVLHPNRVVVSVIEGGIVSLLFDDRGAQPDHHAAGRREHVRQPLGPANIEARMIVDLGRGDALARVNVSRFVRHLGSGREPALPDWINHRSRGHEGRPRRPKTHADVLFQPPVIAVSILVVSLGHSTVSLHRAQIHWKAVVSARKHSARAVNFNFGTSVPNRRTSFVRGLADRKQLHSRALAIRELDLLRLAHVNIHSPEKGLLRNREITEQQKEENRFTQRVHVL